MPVGVECSGLATRLSRCIAAPSIGLALLLVYACGGGSSWGTDMDASAGSSSGGGGTSSGGPSSGGLIFLPDGSMSNNEAGTGQSSSGGSGPAIGTVASPDCAGCTFPPAGAASCANGPAINLVYPPDTVLLPPNMNMLSVQWTPFGGYQHYSVDFESSPNTDWHILTSCTNQTTDMQAGGSPSGGCEITVDPVSWSKLVTWNRDGNPVAVTVRGTTDGQCATASNTININFAKEDLLGTYYYWKSTVTSGQGVGGQIWAKIFGDLNTNEQDVTSNVATSRGTLQATCNGCHALSRDGTRMVVYSDDNDSDDEYTDVGGSLLDMTANPPTELGVGVNGSRQGGQPPGFTAINPLASYYISSNGIPLTASGAPPTGGLGVGGAGSSTSAGYPNGVPANAVSLWNGMGNFVNAVSIGGAMTRPTMPDWSVDGQTVIYVQPSSVASFQLYFDFGGNARATDDDHVYGGSLYTVPYMGGGMFGTPTVFLQSGGENNYYPSFSPDGSGATPPSFVLFNQVANNAGAGTSCSNGFCPNDSFSNPDARLMLMANKANAPTIDLEKANGSPLAAPVGLSNSYPRWAPFVQTYHGNKILWFTFSSTRDYGVRILNHKTGMYQCYPPDTPEVPAAMHGSTFDPACQQPQIWMAPILFSEGQSATADPSRVAFWIPYQDMSTHNHTAQWTWGANPPPGGPDGGVNCTCSMQYGKCGAANGGCGCCSGQALTCNGSGECIMPAN